MIPKDCWCHAGCVRTLPPIQPGPAVQEVLHLASDDHLTISDSPPGWFAQTHTLAHPIARRPKVYCALFDFSVTIENEVSLTLKEDI